MRILFSLILICVSIAAFSQTTTTRSALDKMTTKPLTSTVYRVYETDTLYYKAVYAADAEDGYKVIKTASGVPMKLIWVSPGKVSSSTTTTTTTGSVTQPVFTSAQWRAIDSLINVRTPRSFYSGTDFYIGADSIIRLRKQ